MTQKEIVKLKSRFEDFASAFQKQVANLDAGVENADGDAQFHDLDLVLAAVNAGKCMFIAELIGDQHLSEQSKRIADKLTRYYC